MTHAQTSFESSHAEHNGLAVPINGSRTPELAASGDANSILHKINGNGVHNANSPAAESPATPISTAAAPDVKIDIDYQEPESDVRHEPITFKPIDSVDKQDDASIVPQVGTPADPNTIPIHAPNGTPPPPLGELLYDVKMAEQTNGLHSSVSPHLNGANGDVVMNNTEDQPTPVATPKAESTDVSMNLDSVGSHSSLVSTRRSDDDDESRPPPAKRARMHSDADRASMTHSVTPPPASPDTKPPASTASPPPASGSTVSSPVAHSPLSFTTAQFRFCQSTVRTLKKIKEAAPFLRPVDPVALNIPHYPSIIKNPMDFATIDRKLASSNPTKPDPNSNNPRYNTVDEFINDVRLIFQNCLTFNGPDHAISAMGKRVEEVFDRQLKSMPVAIEPKPPVVKKVATPPPPPPPPPPAAIKKTIATRRASTSVPVIRRSDVEAPGRPKREIHPPPPKDLPYADAPKKHRKGKRVKDDGTAEQLKFCSKILQEIHRKQHYTIASPFYEPVDYIKMEIPSYPKIVKKPMDLSTIRRKIDNQEYQTADKFFEDFKLMIRNCFLFNPAGTLVNQAGIELQRLFDEKWKGLPPIRDTSDDDEEEEFDEEFDSDRQRAIELMEKEIEAMRGNIEALKTKPKEKKEKKKKDKAPVASTSKASSKPVKASSKKKGKKPVSDDDVLTFEQKKDLSESIGRLDDSKLEKVIQIIHEGVPEIRDSTEEIELEIDLLPAAVLTKLYNFVIRPTRQPASAKRSRTGKGTGTGGLKRKSMDEDVEAEKIRLLEERMALFERGGGGGGGSGTQARREDDSEHSSDSSSASDSSGSDSE